MRSIVTPFVFIATVILVWVCLAMPAMAAPESGGSISGRVYFNTGDQNIPSGTNVSLVNGANVSEYIAGYNVTADKNGYFQFTNVSKGFYKVYAWSPYYTEGYSDGINVNSSDTYTASVVLLAMPYYASITADTQHVVYGSQASVTVQAEDYWGKPVGSGWQILLRTTVGLMDPDSAVTDKNGKVYSKIAWVDNSTPANITIFAISTNGSSYGLLENDGTDQATATPVPSATATATPTASPTVVPNATVTAMPTATPTPLPTPSAKPTPGFELIAVLAATGMAIAIRRNK